ncbi:MAG: hypothetical protein U1D29_05025 [Burkholderiales bacterium]|nr:hypothetical protein [Burkholderiales bacterium]
MAWLFAGEQYSAIKLTGAGITLAGVALAQFGSNRLREAPALVD